MAKGIRPGHVALIAGASVALALATALLAPSLASWFDVSARNEARRPAQAAPAASPTPALDVAPAQAAPEPTEPLALPTRPLAVAPRRTGNALGLGTAQTDTRTATPPATADAVQPVTLSALRTIRSPAVEASGSAREQSKNSSAPADAPSAKRSDDCDVPYYYEGRKKVFKDACI